MKSILVLAFCSCSFLSIAQSKIACNVMDMGAPIADQEIEVFGDQAAYKIFSGQKDWLIATYQKMNGDFKVYIDLENNLSVWIQQKKFTIVGKLCNYDSNIDFCEEEEKLDCSEVDSLQYFKN